MWVLPAVSILVRQMNTSISSTKLLRKIRKSLPKLPKHLAHIPIEICSDSISFRLKPSLKARILRRAEAEDISMTKIFLQGMEYFLSVTERKEVKK